MGCITMQEYEMLKNKKKNENWRVVLNRTAKYHSGNTEL